MTANEIDLVSSSQIENLSISNGTQSNNNNNNNANNSSYEHPKEIKASQSQPNLSQLGNDDDDDENDELTVSGTAYNYAASTLSDAYSYMTSFYPSSPHSLPKQSHSQSQPPPNESTHSQQQQKHNQSNNEHIKPAAPQINPSFDASAPDRIKYPRACNDSSASNSDLHSILEQVQASGLDVAWTSNLTEPLAENVKLRSLSYKSDGKKEIGREPAFRLVHVQAFKTDIMIDHIAMHPSSWFNQNISMEDMSCFTLIVHLQAHIHIHTPTYIYIHIMMI